MLPSGAVQVGQIKISKWAKLEYQTHFYAWRKRLQKKEPVRFALVDRGAARQEAAVELVLATGERLRISAGVDGATLRTVLDALRA
jgi:hypothetical protein